MRPRAERWCDCEGHRRWKRERSLYVLRSRASRSRCSIPGISGRVDVLTSPVAAARAAVATGARGSKCGSSSFIFEKSVVYKSTWYLVRYMQAPNRLYKSEVRASVLRVKLLVSRDSVIARSTCYKQSNAFFQRRRKAKRSFPMERGPTAKHHAAWNPQCTPWFRACLLYTSPSPRD